MRVSDAEQMIAGRVARLAQVSAKLRLGEVVEFKRFRRLKIVIIPSPEENRTGEWLST
jgi:hypothetical protein